MNKNITKLREGLLRLTPFKRLIFFFLADLFLIALSLYMSFWLRFDGMIPAELPLRFPAYLGLILAVKISLLAAFGMYKISWRFFGLSDLVKLIAAVSTATLVLAAVYLSFRTRGPFAGFPRAVMLADYVYTPASLVCSAFPSGPLSNTSANPGE